nr:sodium-dependent transporter [Virgibacillus halodenitrificans]
MPLLFIFFIILVLRSITLDGAMAGIEFFLSPDFSRITGEGILYALGQSFFSLAVGFSCMVTYSSYLSKQESIPNSAGSVVTLNILVSLLAGLAIFPVVFAFGLEPAAGPGLLFVVLPTVFSQMAFGSVFLALFLLLFLFATLTSSFSLLEIIISAFIANKNYTRRKVTLITGCIVFLASIPAALSFGVLAGVSIFGKSVFDATDFLVSNILLPLGSLLIAIFISFRMDQAIVMEEFRSGSKVGMGIFKAWRFLMRYVVPVTILIVFIYSLGFI